MLILKKDRKLQKKGFIYFANKLTFGILSRYYTSPEDTASHTKEGGAACWAERDGWERESNYNPKVADSLTRMAGMGFTDDEGWLTQLLILKQGDISQVDSKKIRGVGGGIKSWIFN